MEFSTMLDHAIRKTRKIKNEIVENTFDDRRNLSA